MMENKWLGSKTEQGFYKKVKTADGKSEIQGLNLETYQYENKEKPNFHA